MRCVSCNGIQNWLILYVNWRSEPPLLSLLTVRGGITLCDSLSDPVQSIPSPGIGQPRYTITILNYVHSICESFFVGSSRNATSDLMAATFFVGTEIERWPNTRRVVESRKNFKNFFSFISDGFISFSLHQPAFASSSGGPSGTAYALWVSIGMQDSNGPEGEQEVLRLQREGP